MRVVIKRPIVRIVRVHDTRRLLRQSRLINPPGNPKAKFFLNAELPASADEWLATAKPEADSWWSDWRQWLGERSGERRPAPETPGNERHPPVADAPGTYVAEM
ncbi:hypothetical protein [Paraburkholderia hospita]|uniref:hypothetical protein n=1 Tax=Paraburkholderia hospita TaxID=169430 RepID=UPI003ED11AB8